MNAYSGKNRRRNVLSLPGTQLRIILFFGLLALLYAGLNAYVSKNAFRRLAADTRQLVTEPGVKRDLLLMISEQEATLDLQLSLFTFLSFFMLTLAGVLISHRLGGPVYHLKHYLDSVGTGTTTPRPIKFRKNDFFHDLADSFNRFQTRHGLLKPAEPGAPASPGGSGKGL